MVPSNFLPSAVKFGCRAVSDTEVMWVDTLGIRGQGFLKCAPGFLRVIVLQTPRAPLSSWSCRRRRAVLRGDDDVCLHFFPIFFPSPSVICKASMDGNKICFQQVVVVKDLTSDQRKLGSPLHQFIGWQQYLLLQSWWDQVRECGLFNMGCYHLREHAVVWPESFRIASDVPRLLWVFSSGGSRQ